MSSVETNLGLSIIGRSRLDRQDWKPAQAGCPGASMSRDSTSLKRLISIDEAAEWTGLSVYTIYNMVSQRRIPYVKVGRLTKFDVGLLEAWLKQHTVMPMPEKRS